MLGENGPIAVFKTAKCRRDTSSEGKTFFAEMEVNGGEYRLVVKIWQFAGFQRKYEIEQGPIDPNPGITLIDNTNGTVDYSSRFIPPFEAPGFGLAQFRQGGRLFGVGYGPAMWKADFSQAVLVTGEVECQYPTKRKKR